MKANNPFLILGVSPMANDETIRSAYLEKLRQFPPEKESERFKEISDAFERIGHYRKRFDVWSCERTILESRLLEGLPEVIKHMPPPQPYDYKTLQKFLRTVN